MKRTYDITAISVRIVLNHFGDYDPDGQMYVLREYESKIQKQINKNPYSPVDLVQPLAIRACEGDIVEIHFTNKLIRPAGIHFQEADYDIQMSDGANVGLNTDTLAEPGQTITYKFTATHEGIYFFSDLGNPASSELGSNLHGLYGAILVERRGSWWTDPVTGGPLKSGVYADVHHPFLPSFREYAWFFGDEQEVKDLTGNRPIDPMTGQEAESTQAVNYRYEPLLNRKKLIEEGIVCPDCEGEEVHHDSWVFGDPATPILRGYRGDPAKIRLIHGGVKETHVFHYHVHQWFKDTSNKDSEILDAQAISPQNHYTIEPLYGLGSLHGAIGDVIVHCHLYPHFMAGMWGMNRIFDTLQDGTQCYPNGVKIEALQPLPDRPKPPKATPERPGFPNFVPGRFGSKAPRPPLGIKGGRGLTKLERDAAIPNARPGAVFAEPRAGAFQAPVVEYYISAIELPITYNRQEWIDPSGRIFVLDEDKEDVLCGKKEPEPLVIHAQAGSTLRVHFTNCLPQVLDGNAFQLVTRTYEVGMHIHFVKFDVLVNDGANVGWNYDSSVLPGETIQYEYFADTELKAWFFHDHLFPTTHQQHGLFGCGVVQPRFSIFLSSETGEPVKRGTQITVENPLIPNYRDFVLFAQDFVSLFNKQGKPIQPPPFPSSQQDPGVFAVNYRNEPLQFRLGKEQDPAYSFSSFVGGDPVTPILQTYEGDPIRVRLLQGAQEESHSFNIHGLRWKEERPDSETKFRCQQHIGISESFTFETYIPRSGDYLWAFETEDDLWIGCWGLIRGFKERQQNLIPLKDRPIPPPHTTNAPKMTGSPPSKAPSPVNVGPADAPVRRFKVVAFQTNIVYNDHYGEHDPYGIVFALKDDTDDIINGVKHAKPLILRANAGDVVEIILESRLEKAKFEFPNGIYPYPVVPEQALYPPSLRISLHPQLLQYDVQTSGGETVGFNPDGTVGPGETITYKWYVDQPFGACGLWDMADIRNHRSQGAFGSFIAEPRGTKYYNSSTLQPALTEETVVLRNHFLPTIREFVLILHDGVRLRNQKNEVIIDPGDGIIGNIKPNIDPEDQGSRGFNYRTERLINRYEEKEDVHLLFNSKEFGDPVTPFFEAYARDPVVIRLVNPAERRRSYSFHIHGHYWRNDELDINTAPQSVTGQITTGYSNNFYLYYGAGGLIGNAGDYMYRAGNIRWALEQGLWGLLRVYKEKQSDLPPL